MIDRSIFFPGDLDDGSTDGITPPSPNAASRRTPLRLLVVADLAPGGEAGPLPVSGDAGAALAAISPVLSLAVPNRLGSGPRELDVALRFTRLEDFHPDAIAARLPVPIRGLQAAAPGRACGNPLDSLLAQVDVPSVTGAPHPSRRRWPRSSSRSGSGRWRRTGAASTSSPAAPPGIRRSGSRSCPLPRRRSSTLSSTPSSRPSTRAPPRSRCPPSSSAMSSTAARRTSRRCATRRGWGRACGCRSSPPVGAPFWGLRQAKLLAGLPDLVRKLQGPEYAKWNGLRAEEASLWLCLAANRFLLRDGWPGGTDRPLWGSGAYALAAVLARGFAAGRRGFPLAGEPSRLADLPGEPAVEVPLPDAKTLELARIGLAPLISVRGETAAHFPSMPTLHAPKRYVKDEATRSAAIVATLPYQAFGGAAAHALQELARQTGGGLSPEEVKQRFVEGLLAFLAGAEEAPTAEEVEVEVQPNAEDPGASGRSVADCGRGSRSPAAKSTWSWVAWSRAESTMSIPPPRRVRLLPLGPSPFAVHLLRAEGASREATRSCVPAAGMPGSAPTSACSPARPARSSTAW